MRIDGSPLRMLVVVHQFGELGVALCVFARHTKTEHEWFEPNRIEWVSKEPQRPLRRASTKAPDHKRAAAGDRER